MCADRNNDKFRIDKWLHAARFYKTRSLAAAAVECGQVEVNNMRVKPAKVVAKGDVITINIGQRHYIVEVLALSNRRGPAPEAQLLYRETDASRARRATIAAQLKDQPRPFLFKGRPTKRDRREIDRLRRQTR